MSQVLKVHRGSHCLNISLLFHYLKCSIYVLASPKKAYSSLLEMHILGVNVMTMCFK